MGDTPLGLKLGSCLSAQVPVRVSGFDLPLYLCSATSGQFCKGGFSCVEHLFFSGVCKWHGGGLHRHDGVGSSAI